MRTNNSFVDFLYGCIGLFMILLNGYLIFAAKHELKGFENKLIHAKGPDLEAEMNSIKTLIFLLKQQQQELEEQIKQTEKDITFRRKQKEEIIQADKRIMQICEKGYILCDLFKLISAGHVNIIKKKLSELKPREMILINNPSKEGYISQRMKTNATVRSNIGDEIEFGHYPQSITGKDMTPIK